jgi:hypothetical protein
VNCSTAVPEEFVALHPVQLVSMDEVLGEMEKVPFEEVVVDEVPPPQPARRRKIGSPVIASNRAGHERRHNVNLPPLLALERRSRFSVTDAWSINSFSAFPDLPSAPKPLWTLLWQSFR